MPPRKTSNSTHAPSSSPAASSSARLHLPRGRRPRARRTPGRGAPAGTAGRRGTTNSLPVAAEQRVDLELRHRDPALELEGRRRPRVQLADHAGARLADQDAADRPGWNGRSSALTERPRAARRPRPSAPRGPLWRRGRRTRGAPPPSRRPAGPARANATLARSSTGSPSRKTVPISKIATASRPRAWLRATACRSPGVSRVRRNPSSACSGFATAIASVVARVSARSSPGGEREQAHLAQAGPHQGVAQPRRGTRTAAGTPPACPADGTVRADAVVALDPGDLLDQVDLALDVDAVAGHLDLDRARRRRDAPSRAGRTPARASSAGDLVVQEHRGARGPHRDPPSGRRLARRARPRGAPCRPPSRRSAARSGSRRAPAPPGRRRARTGARPRCAGRAAGRSAGPPCA